MPPKRMYININSREMLEGMEAIFSDLGYAYFLMKLETQIGPWSELVNNHMEGIV